MGNMSNRIQNRSVKVIQKIQTGRPRLSVDFGLLLDLREGHNLGWLRVASEYMRITGQYISKQTCKRRYEEGVKDIAEIRQHISRKNELQKIVASETYQIEDTLLNTHILELRKQSLGIESIAKTLGCTTWRVRKCLDNLD
jgi:hypothetical protein